MSAEFFLTHGAAESTAGTEPILPIGPGGLGASQGSNGPEESGASEASTEAGGTEELAKSGEAGDSNQVRGIAEPGQAEDRQSGEPGNANYSYDDLKSNLYAAASKILGSTVEEIARMKPSELAQQLSPKLEEFEGIRSAYEIAKPLVDILAKPASLINSTDFARALAEERPGVYGRLAEELVLRHSPEYLTGVVQRYSQYGPNDQKAIDAALEDHMVARVEQLTGLPLTGDQVADAVGYYVMALKMGQDPREFFLQGAGSNGYPGAGGQLTPPLNGAVAEQIANQLGVDTGDPAVSAAWNMMRQQSAQLARQFGAQIQGLQGKLAMLEQGQRQTRQTLNERRQEDATERIKSDLDKAKDELIGKLRVPQGYEDELDFIRSAVENKVSKSGPLQSLREEIKGWYLEGNPQRAAGLIGRYTNRVGQIVAEVAAPRLRRIEAYEKGRTREVENQGKRRELPAGGSHLGPGGRATNGRLFKNEDEAADAIVGQAMEWLRAKGKEV